MQDAGQAVGQHTGGRLVTLVWRDRGRPVSSRCDGKAARGREKKTKRAAYRRQPI